MQTRTYPDLRTYLKGTRTRQVDLAAQLGITQAYMSKIKDGISEPPLPLALKIADLTGIPLESLIRKNRLKPASLDSKE